MKFNPVFSSDRYKDHAGWVELWGRPEVLPSHHTKETGPYDPWKVMGLGHPITFHLFSKAYTNQIKPSLTPSAWIPSISICFILPPFLLPSFPPLFFLSSLPPFLLFFVEQIDSEHLLCAGHVLVAGGTAVNKTDRVLGFTF